MSNEAKEGLASIMLALLFTIGAGLCFGWEATAIAFPLYLLGIRATRGAV